MQIYNSVSISFQLFENGVKHCRLILLFKYYFTNRAALPSWGVIVTAVLFVFTVLFAATALAQSTDGGVCGWTPQVRDTLLAKVQANDATVTDCSQVTAAHLQALTGTLDLSNRGITSLKPGDLTGLTNLATVFLSGNRLRGLPDGIFEGLANLRDLYLYDNNLRTLPDGIFEGLANLRSLYLNYNNLRTLPDGIFEGLANLRDLYLYDNDLRTLPDGIFEGLANLRDLYLYDNDLRALPDGVFEGLANLSTVFLNRNRLTGLPDGIFDDLANLRSLYLNYNNLRTLPDGIFDSLANLRSLYLENNPGTDSFLPTAAAGADQKAVVGTMVRLDGSASRGGPWSTNITYDWAVADAQGNPVTDLTLTGGDTATPSFTMPATEPDGGLVFTLSVQGKGHRRLGLYKSTASVRVAIQAVPAVISVVLTSAPANGTTYGNGESIEVVVTFEQPATVDISGGTPSIGLTVGAAAKTAGYTRGSGGRNLVFAYEVQASDTDTDGVSVPANSLTRNGGRIGYPDGTVFRLTHNGLSDDISHKVSGAGTPLTGGICGRTSQVRVELLRLVQANDATVTDCSQVTAAHLQALTGTLDLSTRGITSLKPGDLTGLTNLATVFLNGNRLTGLPDGVFMGLANLRDLYLYDNNLRTLPDGIFEGLANLRNLYLNYNDLRALPDGVFEGLANLSTVFLNRNQLTGLPDGIFEGLANLRDLYLYDNNLRTLPDGVFEGLANLRNLYLNYNDLRALPDGVFEGLANLSTVFLNRNQLTGLPDGIFEGLANLRDLYLYDNNLRTLPDGVFEGLANLSTVFLNRNQLTGLPDGIFDDLANLRSLYLENNPGTDSFLPTAAAGADQKAVVGTMVRLDGSASRGGPWGTNITYDWAVADGQGNPVTDLTLTGGDTATPSFTMPATEPDGGLVFTLSVQGKGHRGLGHRGLGLYKSTASVRVAIQAVPAVISVVLTSAPANGTTYGNGESIEVVVTFEQPATVDISGGTPSIGLTVGAAAKTAGYTRGSGGRNLVFAYEVQASDTDTDGVSVPANSLTRNGGRIGYPDGTVFRLTHNGLSDDISHKVSGAGTPLTGGICGRTSQVRVELLRLVQANDATVTDCSQVTAAHLQALTGTLDLSTRGITSLKPGDLTGLTNLATVFLNGNRLTGLPDGIFDDLANLRDLYLNYNNLRTLPDGIFDSLANLRSLYLENNPGSDSFLPTAAAGADQKAVVGTMVRLDGSASRGGPWGTNITYDWAVADGQGNPVTDLTLTGGDTATPSFTMPATEPDGGLVFTLSVQGKGHRGLGLYKSTASVRVAMDVLPLVWVNAVDATVTEGTDAQFIFSRSRDSTSRLEVQVRISGHRKVMTGSTSSAVVTFEAGTTETTMDLATEADTVNEGDGEVSVAIVGSSGVYEIGGTGAATVLVRDDDIPEVTLRWVSPAMTIENNVWVGSMVEGQGIEFDLECTGGFLAAGLTPKSARFPLRVQEVLNHPFAIGGYNDDYKRRFPCAGDQGAFTFPLGDGSKRFVGPDNGRIVVDLFPQVLNLNEIPGRFNNSNYGIICYLDSRSGSPQDIRFCPKYTLGAVTSARIEVTNRNPTLIVEAVDDAVPKGEPARFRVNRIWESDVLAAYSTAFNFKITVIGMLAESVPNASRTFSSGESELIIEIPTVNDGVRSTDGLVTFELLRELSDSQSPNIGGHYEVYDQLAGITPRGKNSRIASGITPRGKNSRIASVRILSNAAPTSADRTVTMDEDTAYRFGSVDFAFTDTDGGDALVSVKVVTAPAAGSLALGAAPVTANQVIGTSDLGRLVFTPVANAHGAGYASFTFKVSDGVSESAVVNTMTMDVTAVNDPASGLVITGTAREGQTLTADTTNIVDADGLTSPELPLPVGAGGRRKRDGSRHGIDACGDIGGRGQEAEGGGDADG